MLDRMNFLRGWSIDGRRVRRRATTPRRALPSIAKDYAARQHRQNFTAAPVSRGLCRHGDVALHEFSLTIEALRRKLRQPASSAIMILDHVQRAWKKFMGLREPFTILRNV